VLGGLKLDVVPVGCSGASGVLQVSPEEFMRDVVSGVGVAEPGLRFDEADLPILRPFLLNPGASEFFPLQEENVGYEHHVGENFDVENFVAGGVVCADTDELNRSNGGAAGLVEEEHFGYDIFDVENFVAGGVVGADTDELNRSNGGAAGLVEEEHFGSEMYSDADEEEYLGADFDELTRSFGYGADTDELIRSNVCADSGETKRW
jgi:hypothetical protein